MHELCPKRILIVDDEEVVQSLCRRLLAPLGYFVDTAVDGRQALAMIEKDHFDLVITDYRLSGDLNGLELGRHIKQRRPRMQMILMTAFPAVDTAVEMLRLGAYDYLIKPFDQRELIRCVTACFAKLTAA